MTKTLTFAVMHVSVAFTVVYLITGNWMVGGIVALVEPMCNSVAYSFMNEFGNAFKHAAVCGAFC